MERPERPITWTFLLSTKVMPRTPSHFTSKSQSGPLGAYDDELAIIGLRCVGILAFPAPGRTLRSAEPPLTLRRSSSESQPALAAKSGFLMSSHSLPLESFRELLILTRA